MRMRTKKWAKPELEVCGFYINIPQNNLGKWKTLYKNKNPLHLELGCGKGIFTANIAERNRNINYLAVDLSTDVLGVCARNIKSAYGENPIDNILITNFNIERIKEVLNDADEIERIYINFCNPWPKKKHKKRRLTHTTKLEMYKSFLADGGKIYFKTDDDELFCESLDYFKESGFELNRVTYDLRKSDFNDESSITTEHEEKFVKEGIAIKFAEVTFHKK